MSGTPSGKLRSNQSAFAPFCSTTLKFILLELCFTKKECKKSNIDNQFLDGTLFGSERPLNEVIELDLGLEIAKRN